MCIGSVYTSFPLPSFIPLLCTRYSFSEFAQRFGRDERFKAVEKMREREQLFSDYLQELKRAGKHRENADGSSHSSSSRSKSDKVHEHV